MATQVRLASIALTDFRNYARMAVDLDGRHLVLTGPNGAGKTNLIEAVSLLSPGRGLRRAQLADMARKGADDGFSVFARLDRDGERFAVGTGTAGAPGAENGARGRRVRIDGTNARTGDELLDLARVLWLTPAMDGLFTGPAADRRRFVDRMVLAIDPGHGRRARDYEQAMRQRNRLLETGNGPQADAMFDAIEAQLAALGTAIIAARQELVTLLSGLIAATDADDAFPRAQIALSGAMEAERARGMPAGELEAALACALAADRHRDRAAGRTLTGPHRADLSVHHAQKGIGAGLCSTGEQKALLTGLVLAHARLATQVSAMTPLLLLDEIAAHLDPRRRAALFDKVHGLGGQAFMTGTDRSLFDALGERAQYLRIEDGAVAADD